MPLKRTSLDNGSMAWSGHNGTRYLGVPGCVRKVNPSAFASKMLMQRGGILDPKSANTMANGPPKRAVNPSVPPPPPFGFRGVVGPSPSQPQSNPTPPPLPAQSLASVDLHEPIKVPAASTTANQAAKMDMSAHADADMLSTTVAALQHVAHTARRMYADATMPATLHDVLPSPAEAVVDTPDEDESLLSRPTSDDYDKPQVIRTGTTIPLHYPQQIVCADDGRKFVYMTTYTVDQFAQLSVKLVQTGVISPEGKHEITFHNWRMVP